MADTKLPTFDGDLKSFLSNLRAASKEYGLTKNESNALARDRVANATNAAGTAVSSLLGLGTAMPLATGAAEALGVGLTGSLANSARKTAATDEIDVTDIYEDLPISLGKFATKDQDGRVYLPRERYDLYNAYQKVQNAQKNPGPAARAAATDFLNNTFAKNLRGK